MLHEKRKKKRPRKPKSSVNANEKHTYIHTTLQSGVLTQFLTPLMLCVLIIIHKWRHLQFKVDSERQIFREIFSWQFFFFYLFRNLLSEISEIADEILFVLIFCFDVWPVARSLANKPTHQQVDHGKLKRKLKIQSQKTNCLK